MEEEFLEEKEIQTGHEKKKGIIHLSVSKFIMILLVTVLGSVGVTCAAMIASAQLQTHMLSSTSNLPPKLIEGLSKSYTLLKNAYMGDLDDQKLIDGALSGFVSGAEDTYTTYLNEKEFSALMQATDSTLEGIGVEVEQVGEYIRVVSPYGESPAAKAGLQTNDLFVEVNGENIVGKSISEVVTLIRGKKGTSVTLKMKRGNSEYTVSVVRDKISLTTVKHELDKTNQNVGIVRISSFAKTTYDELVEAVKDLRTKGVTSFVIDVRSNPGGLLDSVQKIVNMFVEPNKVIFEMENKAEGIQKVFSSESLGSFKVTEPITILIDKGSASASEIFAGALSDLGRAKLVGETSFGKGTAQTVQQLSAETGIKITYSKWLTPNGTWVHKTGIKPDYEVALPEYSKLSFINPDDVHQSGESSDSVLNIQKLLRALDYGAHLTGTYDDETVQAVKQFQKSAQLEETGVVSGDTTRALLKTLREKIIQNDTQLQKAVELLNEK
ncbi:S41 family peptidase [Carnobacteriaceae bacterium zg-84]|uniref:S41 family peptidase n=1 Tax=Granulicatella sp. zg-84 TaxID=2678503 RepID=UPI0013C26492|nr:S41 family peptidase [Granulicatella sp. zg-84]NEW66429.1 PDZ domain-containing protein [Granulicatella sp. zg-84]QMI86366.1 S41 family peptidase [Carnobacteriaceae bacterium zg-84]